MENNSSNTPEINSQNIQTEKIEIPKVKTKSGKKYLLIVLLVLIWAGSMASIYYYAKSNNKTTTDISKSNSSTTQQPAAEMVKTAKFDYRENSIPFTFSYPANWAITTNSAWLSEGTKDQGGRTSYNIVLLAPGSIESETGIGGLVLLKGAKIEVNVSKKTAELDDFIKSYGNMAGIYGIKKVNIGGLEGAQYYQVDEGGIFGIRTNFIKDNQQFSFLFSSDMEKSSSEKDFQKFYDADKKSEFYKNYEDLLSSLAF